MGVEYVLLSVGGSVIFIRSSRRVLPTRNIGNCWGSNKGSSKLKAGAGWWWWCLWPFWGCPCELFLASGYFVQNPKNFSKEKDTKKGRRTEAVRCEEREAAGVSEITEELLLTGRAGAAFSAPADPARGGACPP